MNSEKLYQFSLDLNEFVKFSKQLDAFHYYRYKYFVDNSHFDDPDRECKYAIKTKELGRDQEHELLSELAAAQVLLNKLVLELRDD